MSAADAPDVSGAAAERVGGRRPWRGRRVLLGVTGGIAAYKSIQLARDLTQLGAIVDVVLTHSATAFVGALSFEALTGRPVLQDILAPRPRTGSHPSRARVRCHLHCTCDRRFHGARSTRSQ
jgi:hypothetical protein